MKRFFTMLTTAYTLVILILSIFSYFDLANTAKDVKLPAEVTNLRAFLLTAAGVSVILLYDKISEKFSIFNYIIVDFAVRYCIVFLFSFFGGCFAGIIQQSKTILIASFVFAFFCVLGTYIVTYLSVSYYSNRINKKILRRTK